MGFSDVRESFPRESWMSTIEWVKRFFTVKVDLECSVVRARCPVTRGMIFLGRLVWKSCRSTTGSRWD